MEARDVILGQLRQCLDLKSVGEGLLDRHFILGRELHQEDVHDVEDEQDESVEELNLVSEQKYRDHDQVDQDENGFTRDDPPIDERLRWDDQVENACIGAKRLALINASVTRIDLLCTIKE